MQLSDPVAVGVFNADVRPATHASSTYGIAKRTVDVFGGLLLLLLLLPLLALVSIVIVVDSGLPIFYRCERVGRGGRAIRVMKFRTMRNGSHHELAGLLDADKERQIEYELRRKLRNDPRRTRVGAFLRRSSIDELPQLLNVVRGTMSLVGPRPYLLHELEGLPEAAELVSVRPGLTGLWQVSGRADLSFEERVALEVRYVRSRGVRLDLVIGFRTIRAVIGGQGAY